MYVPCGLTALVCLDLPLLETGSALGSTGTGCIEPRSLSVTHSQSRMHAHVRMAGRLSMPAAAAPAPRWPAIRAPLATPPLATKSCEGSAPKARRLEVAEGVEASVGWCYNNQSHGW